MADITPTFELRKLQWRWSRAPAGGTTEDVAVCTFHFLKAAAPTGPWDDAADLATIEGHVTTYWAAIAPNFLASTVSDQYRWYKDGPSYYKLNGDGTAYIPVGGNPAVRVTEVSTPGTLGGVSELPPQVAMSVTELTSMRKHWGRWYLPAAGVPASDPNGRIETTLVASLMTASAQFYGGLIAIGFQPVVFSIQKPVRLNAKGASLPAEDAVAYAVTQLQIDNLFDVIRRRRYDQPTQRLKSGPL